MSGVKLAWGKHVALHPRLPDDQSAPHDYYRDPKLPTSSGSTPDVMPCVPVSGSTASA